MTTKKHKERIKDSEKQIQIAGSILLFLILKLLIIPANASEVRSIFFSLYSSALIFYSLQNKTSMFSYPVACFWSAIFGSILFYTLFMITFLLSDKETVREMLELIFPDVGSQDEFDLKMQKRIESVMGTCAFSIAALKRQLFHAPWFTAHVLGWMGKMVVIRDLYFCIFIAFAFEVCEVTFTYLIPDFEECWWDSIFLDSLGANLIGMFLGYHLNKFILRRGEEKSESQDKEGKDNGCAKLPSPQEQKLSLGYSFDWAGKEERTTKSSKLLAIISPLSSKYQYRIFHSPKRLFLVILSALFLILVEVNQFLIINSLGIPNTSTFVFYRLVPLGFLAVLATAEFYDFLIKFDSLSDDKQQRNDRKQKSVPTIGPSTLLTLFMVTVELAVCIRFFPSHMLTRIQQTTIGVPYNICISYLYSAMNFVVWYLLRFHLVGYTNFELESTEEKLIADKILLLHASSSDKLGKKNGYRKKCRIEMFQNLPSSLKKKIWMTEAVDLFLVLSFVPSFYLFYVNWKFD